jgi:radical SAM protein with 4Fe4S-binding SPASM domain
MRPALGVRCCVWEITLACNLHCLHCGATAGRKRDNELGTDEALALADDLAGLPCQEVTLMGGELFLRPDWQLIAQRLARGGTDLVIFSNGLLLNRQRVKMVRELGVGAVGLSLDSARPVVHDTLRGASGAHRQVWRAIELLRAANIPTSVVTTLTRRNLYELPLLSRQLLGKGIHWQLQVASCNGRRMPRQEQLTPLEFYWVGTWLSIVRQKYDWPTLPVAGAHDLGHHSQHLGNLLPPGCDWTGCTAGIDTLGIQSHGAVKGCLSLPDGFVEGNVRLTPIGQLWRDPNRFSLNRAFDASKLQGYCADCSHGPSCRGGCSDLAQSATGSAYDNPYCFHRIEQEPKP